MQCKHTWSSTLVSCGRFIWIRQHWRCKKDRCYFTPPANGVVTAAVSAHLHKTDYTFSLGPLGLSCLIPLSVVRALELSAMYSPWSLIYTHTQTHTHTHRHTHTHANAHAYSAFPFFSFRPSISVFSPSRLLSRHLALPFSPLAPPRFNFPMWCQSCRRWRGRAKPEDIPLSFQYPFTSLGVKMEGSKEKSRRNKEWWKKKQ